MRGVLSGSKLTPNEIFLFIVIILLFISVWVCSMAAHTHRMKSFCLLSFYYSSLIPMDLFPVQGLITIRAMRQQPAFQARIATLLEQSNAAWWPAQVCVCVRECLRGGGGERERDKREGTCSLAS